MDKELDKKADEVTAFFKAAFGADSAEIMPPSFRNRVKVEGVVRMHDQRRGTFYVALVQPLE